MYIVCNWKLQKSVGKWKYREEQDEIVKWARCSETSDELLNMRKLPEAKIHFVHSQMPESVALSGVKWRKSGWRRTTILTHIFPRVQNVLSSSVNLQSLSSLAKQCESSSYIGDVTFKGLAEQLTSESWIGYQTDPQESGTPETC